MSFYHVTMWEEGSFTIEPYKKAMYNFGKSARHVTLKKDYDVGAMLRASQRSGQ